MQKEQQKILIVDDTPANISDPRTAQIPVICISAMNDVISLRFSLRL